jgi:hypothetical protein
LLRSSPAPRVVLQALRIGAAATRSANASQTLALVRMNVPFGRL